MGGLGMCGSSETSGSEGGPLKNAALYGRLAGIGGEMYRKSKGDPSPDCSAAPEKDGRGAAPAALHVLVSGRVQGVGFRYACYAQARRLGLRGWVRNTPEGGVEVWVEGPEQEPIEAMAAWLRRGPPYARVDKIRRETVPPTGAYQEFSIES